MAENIEARVKEIIAQQLEVNPEQVRPEASFTDDLKADSLAVVELVLALEEAFKIEIPDEDTEQIRRSRTRLTTSRRTRTEKQAKVESQKSKVAGLDFQL